MPHSHPTPARRTLAAFMNAWLPGLGHLYLGRIRSGMAYLAITVMLVLAIIPDARVLMATPLPTMNDAMAGAPMPQMPGHLLLYVLLLTMVFLIAIWDVARAPKDQDSE